MTRQYSIDLKAQQTATESYVWEVDDDFFAETGGFAVKHGHVSVSLEVRRIVADDYKLSFRFQGEVEVSCDRCLEPMRLPIAGENDLSVQLGQTSMDSDEPVADSNGIVDLAWHIYEMIVLQIPLRHVHAEGECMGEIAEVLGQYVTSDDETEKRIDPRWKARGKILSNN